MTLVADKDVIRYTKGAELDPIETTWLDPAGTVRNFSTGWTFTARVGSSAGTLLEKTTGFVGAASAPNLTLTWGTTDLDVVPSGSYHLEITARNTGLGTDLVRTWLFQILPAVGGGLVPAPQLDLFLPVAGFPGNGTVQGGSIRRVHSIQVPWTYTQTVDPADVAVGTAVLVDADVTASNNGTGFGPIFQTGFFGPRGVFQFEGLVRYGANMSALSLAPVGYGDFICIANTAGVARNITPAWGFLSARSVIADAATVTLGPNDTAAGGSGFVDTPVYCSVDGGTLNGTTNSHEIISFLSQPSLMGNVAMTRRVGFDAKGLISQNPGTGHWSGAGTIDPTTATLTEEIGLRVRPMSVATRRIGVLSQHPVHVGYEAANLSVLGAGGSLRGLRIGQDGTGANVTFTADVVNTWQIVGVDFTPTVVATVTSNVLSSGQLFNNQATIKNANGTAVTMAAFFGDNQVPTFQGDGATLTHVGFVAFRDRPILNRINAGAVNMTDLITMQSAPTIDTGCTVTTRRGMTISDFAGAGSITTQVGVEVAAMTKGGTNIGIRNASTEVATPSVATLAAVGNTITPDAKVKRLDNTSGGVLTLTSNPHISDGQDGQLLILFNSSVNDVVLTDGNGVQLGAATRAIGQRDTLTLIYSTTIGDWLELAFTNN